MTSCTESITRQTLRLELSDQERLLWMARSVGSRGYLHRFVPKQPGWCRKVGDITEDALQRGQPLHPFELDCLTYAFEKAAARERAQLDRVKAPEGRHEGCRSRQSSRHRKNTKRVNGQSSGDRAGAGVDSDMVK